MEEKFKDNLRQLILYHMNQCNTIKELDDLSNEIINEIVKYKQLMWKK